MTPTNHSITSSEREGLTWAKVSRFLSLPFQPSRLSTYLAAKRFDEVPLNTLLQDGIKGVLIDADGTIGPHHTRDIDVAILVHIQKMLQQGLQVEFIQTLQKIVFNLLKSSALKL